MKKISTTYSCLAKNGYRNWYITVSDDNADHLSVHNIEPCDGVLKHWGTKKELIDELKEIIKSIEEVPTNHEKTN